MMLAQLNPVSARTISDQQFLACEHKSITLQQFKIDKDKAEKQDSPDLTRISKLSRAIKLLDRYNARFCSDYLELASN